MKLCQGKLRVNCYREIKSCSCTTPDAWCNYINCIYICSRCIDERFINRRCGSCSYSIGYSCYYCPCPCKGCSRCRTNGCIAQWNIITYISCGCTCYYCCGINCYC